MPAAAAALAQQVFGDLAGQRVLLLGAGKMSELTARNLVSRGARRSPPSRTGRSSTARSSPAARRAGARARRRSRPSSSTPTSSSSSTSAPGLVAHARDVAPRCGRARAGRSCSSTSPCRATSTRRSTSSTGCFLYDVDDLEAVVAETLSGRRSEAARRGAARRRGGRALPRVAGVARRRADDRLAARARRGDPRQRARAGRRRGSPRRERRHVESVTSQILAKLLHLPTIRMKEAAAAADGVVYADVVRHLFGLGEEERRR